MKLIDIFFNYAIKNICSFLFFRKNNGIFIFDEQWDNLIILDNCRYDVFKEEFERRGMKGRLEYRISRGSDTSSFLKENFYNKKCSDIVYVTANPWVNVLLKHLVFKVISVWKFAWDEKLQNVSPKAVYEYAVYAMHKYKDKRIIVHFIQPHSPYPNGLGETKAKNAMFAIVNKKQVKNLYKIDDNLYITWPCICLRRLKIKNLIKGYYQNLRLVMPYVEKLVNIMPGTTVVTSDHGEAFGERIHKLLYLRVYGHPDNIKTEQLVKVPWLVVNEKEKDVIEKPEVMKIIKLIEKNRIKNIVNDMLFKIS